MADVIHALSEAVDKHGLLAVLVIAIVIGGFFLLRVLGDMSRSISTLTSTALAENTESNHIAADRMTKAADKIAVLNDSINRLADATKETCKVNDSHCKAMVLIESLRGQAHG